MVNLLRVLGILLVILGIADFALSRFGGRDLTGVWWSAIALVFAGTACTRISRLLLQQNRR